MGDTEMANGSSPCREHHEFPPAEQGKVSPARELPHDEEGRKTSPAVSALGIPVSFPPRRGGWRTAPYIFGAGAIDFLASIGIMINMMAYLKGRLGLTTVDAANTITNFMGMCSYTPLVGAFIADAYIGRYKTILIASIIYVLGLVVLVMETKLPSTKSPNCTKDECLGYLYAGFVLIAVAAGGIRPNAPAFGADQFDQKDPVERQQLYGYFNWYYFFIVVAVMTSSTLLVYIQNTVGWFWGFGVPAMSMLAAVALFWAGSPLYRRMVPLGSPFTRLAQVVTAAFRKRKLTLPEDPNTLYTTKCVDHDKLTLSHTMQYRFLDKAAIVTPDDSGDGKTQADAWRLCEVNQVEELKSLLRMAPVWATGIPIFIAWSQQTTFWLAEGYMTNLQLGKFKVPGGSLPVFASITMLLFLPLYDRLLVPLAKRMTKNPRGITFLQRIGIGILFAALSMVTAGLVAVKRRTHHSYPAMSCFWMVPQFCLLGLSEAFVVIGYLEFFYDQSPPSMRSMAAAVVWAIVGTGNYCSSLIVLGIKKWTSKKAHGVRDGWLADNPNQGHFEYFYWLLAVLLAADFVVHLLVSASYKYTKPDYSARGGGGGGDEEDEKVPVMF